MKLPADLRPEQVVAIIDSREQRPADLAPLQTVAGSLTTGDYSLAGCEHLVAIERKSLPDLVQCVGRERERFDREIERMRGYECKALVVESDWPEIELGGWRGQVKSNQVVGSLLGWATMGIPLVMAGNHQRAGQFIGRILFCYARRRWRELRVLAGELEETTL